MLLRLRRGGRASILITLIALLIAACSPTVGQPALRQQPSDPQVWDNSDPAVLVYTGKTYLFGSTNNRRAPVRLVSSYAGTVGESKTQWANSAVEAMPTRPAWVDATEDHTWAPSVVRIGTYFVMYFAGKNKAATTDEVNDQCIGRAIATAPMGPYAPEANPVYCGYPAEGPAPGLPSSNSFGRGALDPEVFRAPDGALYLLVALSRTKDNIGVVKLRSDGQVIGGRNVTPTILASQSMPWHDGTDDSTRGSGFLENPTMIYEGYTKTYLLFFSAGAWNTASYNTSFARCASPTGPCSQDTRGPFLVGGNYRSGPGGMTVFVDASGKARVAYATWANGHESPSYNPGGIYSRQTHWNLLKVTVTSDPAKQAISLV